MLSLTPLQKKRLKKALPQLFAALAVLCITAGAIGAVVIQKSLQEESQDTRSQASIADGTVFVRSPQQGQSTAFTQNSERSLQLEVSTQGEKITQLHLVFNIITTVFDPPFLKLPSNSKLQILSQELEKTTDGFLVSSILEPKSSTEPFSTTAWEPLAELVFTPVRGGTIKIAFDAETSTALSATTGTDILKHVDLISYSILGGPSASPIPEGVGGIAVDLCNALCFTNAQCGPNQRCFDTGTEQRCRLVTNVSSTSCASPSTLGQNRSCNESCTDSRECGTGLSCWYNLCRNSVSVEDASCAVPSATQQQALAAQCNTTCQTNADCANNLRCFANECRLATNPSSTTCSPASAATVSTRYPNKGGTFATTTTPAPQPSAPPTVLPSTAPSTAPTPLPTETPVPSLEPTATDTFSQDRTAFDDFISLFKQADPRALTTWFQSQLSAEQLAVATQFLPIVLVGIGLLILLIVIGFFIKQFFQKDRTPHVAPQTFSNKPADKTSGVTLTSTKKEAATTPTIPKLPDSPAPRMTHSLGMQPATSPSSRTSATTASSPMLDRLKAKGVTPPK